MKISTVISIAVLGLLLIKFGLGVVPPILIIGLIIFIHEYGHYTLMRRNGVKVEEFSIGFGPTLYERQLKSGTKFSIKMLLLGGSARPVAEGEGSMESVSAWARIKIYMAGMFFNACAGFVAYVILFYWRRTGPDWLIDMLNASHAPHALRPLVAAFIMSFGAWLATPVLVVVGLFHGLSEFFGGTAGPVGIAQIGADAFGHNRSPMDVLRYFLAFFAMINVALAGMNLLPLFPLDGGRVFDEFLGFIPGRAGKLLVSGYRHLTGLAIFALIMAILLMDLWRVLPHR